MSCGSWITPFLIASDTSAGPFACDCPMPGGDQPVIAFSGVGACCALCACNAGDDQPIGGRRGGAWVTPSSRCSVRGRGGEVSDIRGSKRKVAKMAPQCAPQAATQQLEWPCPLEPGASIVAQRDGVWDEV